MTILAVLADAADALGDPKTSVVRYELSFEEEEVHPVFVQMSPSTNTSTTSVCWPSLTNLPRTNILI